MDEFENLSGAVRAVATRAEDEARRLDHNYVGSEHILLALLREKESVTSKALGRLGVTHERVRAQVARITSKDMPLGSIPFSSGAERVLGLAEHEAAALCQDQVGAEHVLLGLSGEKRTVGARILSDFDVDVGRLRDELDGS